MLDGFQFSEKSSFEKNLMTRMNLPVNVWHIFGNITFMKTDYKQKLVEKRQNDYYLNNEQAWSASYTY